MVSRKQTSKLVTPNRPLKAHVTLAKKTKAEQQVDAQKASERLKLMQLVRILSCRSTQLDKDGKKVEANSALPKRLPNFMRPSYLNGFTFALGDGEEEYEYFNGKFFKREAILRPG